VRLFHRTLAQQIDIDKVDEDGATAAPARRQTTSKYSPACAMQSTVAATGRPSLPEADSFARRAIDCNDDEPDQRRDALASRA
jgi:hypothetical protein